VPAGVVAYVADQLGITDLGCLSRYTTRTMTAYEHAWEIRKVYGFKAFEDDGVSVEFRRFLDGRAWTHAEGPGALFDQGVGCYAGIWCCSQGSPCRCGWSPRCVRPPRTGCTARWRPLGTLLTRCWPIGW